MLFAIYGETPIVACDSVQGHWYIEKRHRIYEKSEDSGRKRERERERDGGGEKERGDNDRIFHLIWVVTFLSEADPRPSSPCVPASHREAAAFAWR